MNQSEIYQVEVVTPPPGSSSRPQIFINGNPLQYVQKVEISIEHNNSEVETHLTLIKVVAFKSEPEGGFEIEVDSRGRAHISQYELLLRAGEIKITSSVTPVGIEMSNGWALEL